MFNLDTGDLYDRETVRDIHAEAEEMDAHYANGCYPDDNGPDRLEDDEYADAIGRRIVCELGGC